MYTYICSHHPMFTHNAQSTTTCTSTWDYYYFPFNCLCYSSMYYTLYIHAYLCTLQLHVVTTYYILAPLPHTACIIMHTYVHYVRDFTLCDKQREASSSIFKEVHLHSSRTQKPYLSHTLFTYWDRDSSVCTDSRLDV